MIVLDALSSHALILLILVIVGWATRELYRAACDERDALENDRLARAARRYGQDGPS